MNLILAGALGLLLAGCGERAADPDTTLVISSDPELRRVAAALLPSLAERSGLELREPVRVERRTREELVRYLEAKLDEELPPDEEASLARAYALMGLFPENVALRDLLMSVYTEQVAGFYDPDSTALFVLDDQPAETLESLLVHELVHAIQDQTTSLDSITDRSRGNDRQSAAQAAIEGHATLVMLEHMLGQMQGGEVDLSEIPDFAAQIRPALEGMRAQYPALADAPRVIQETILFPYLEGAGFVQHLWAVTGDRRPPFGDELPESTEQVVFPERFVGQRDTPTTLLLSVGGRAVVYENVLGQLETRILVEELAGSDAGPAARGWDGDRYVLLDGRDDLVWATVWDDAEARDGFVRTLRPALAALPRPATVEVREVEGRPVAIVVIGEATGVEVTLEGGEPTG